MGIGFIITHFIMIARSLIRQCFSGAAGGDYVPIRPLREPITPIFKREYLWGIPFRNKFLVYLPFLAALGEGVINQWTWLLGIGSLGLLAAGFSTVKGFEFYGSHEINSLSVNPNLSKFYLLLANNWSSRQMEEQVLTSQGTTFEKKLIAEVRSEKVSGWASEEVK